MWKNGKVGEYHKEYAMKDPWFEEREVVAEDSVTVPAGIFFTLRTKITSEWMGETDLWYRWIAEEGIIKDTLYYKGIATDTLGNEIGYFEADDVYELLDFQTGMEENTHRRLSTIITLQTYPNPFHSIVTIQYSIAKPTRVTLRIYDVTGRLIRTLVSERQQPGSNAIHWDRRDDSGQEVMSGIYFCHLEAGNFVSVKKIVILQ